VATYAGAVPDFVGLLRQLAALEPPLFVFGSVAEAALLNGELSHSYGDVDVLIPRTELEWRLRQLAVLGFDAFTVYYEPRPGLPLVYGSTRGDLALELSLVDYDSAGNPFFVVRTDEGAIAVSVPADLFRWPPTVIDGVSIHTLSPLALVHLRAGASATRAFGPERPGKDDIAQTRMIETFFPDADPDLLRPTITRIGDGG
jgi:hypothetical protein